MMVNAQLRFPFASPWRAVLKAQSKLSKYALGQYGALTFRTGQIGPDDD